MSAAPNAGYSGTPLPKKLGIKPGTRYCVLGAPKGYVQSLGLGDDVRVSTRLAAGVDLVHLFVTDDVVFRRRLAEAFDNLGEPGAIWVSWPKKSSGVATTVTEETIRAVALPMGLVDNKVCAVDEVWSALRLARRRR